MIKWRSDVPLDAPGYYFALEVRRAIDETFQSIQDAESTVWPDLSGTEKRIDGIASGRSVAMSQNAQELIHAECWPRDSQRALAQAHKLDQLISRPRAFEPCRDVVGIGALNVDHVLGTSRSPVKIRDKGAQEMFGEHYELLAETEQEIDDDISLIGGPQHFEHRHGGSAYNVIRILSHDDFRCKTGYIGVDGVPPNLARDSAGQRLARQRSTLPGRCEAQFVFRSKGRSGRCASIVFDMGMGAGAERRMRVWPGANDQLGENLRRNLYDVVEFLCQSRVVHVSSLFHAETAKILSDTLWAVRRLSPHTVISMDPGAYWCERMPEAVESILPHCSLLFVSAREFQILAERYGIRSPGQNPGEATARELRGRMRLPASTVVVVKYVGETIICDEFGRTVVHGDPADRREVDDDTGAGDVFAAGYLGERFAPGLASRRGALMGMRVSARKVSQLGMIDRIPPD